MPKKKKSFKWGIDYHGWAIMYKGEFMAIDGNTSYHKKIDAINVSMNCGYIYGNDCEIVPVRFVEIDEPIS